LKTIQERIKVKILYKVFYPRYLQGSIKDDGIKRSYISNAKIHANSRIVINEDITKFFPSTSEQLIFDIWKIFFGFSDKVARYLTKLTTKDGLLPEGAKTSSYLANLVLI
jgi:hypothetical protein